MDSKHPLRPPCWLPFPFELLQVWRVPVACRLTCQTPESRDECDSCLGGCSGYFGPSIHTSIFCHCLFCNQGDSVAADKRNLKFDIPTATADTEYFPPLCNLKMVQEKMSLPPPLRIPLPHRRTDELKLQFWGEVCL